MAKPSPIPAITISMRAAARLRSGHPWVYRSDLLKSAQETPAAVMVHVKDERARMLGTALSSSTSQIALRMVDDTLLTSDAALLALIESRVAAAMAYRREVVHDSNACRLVFSEADGLPGLIADRYNDIIAVQFLTQCMDRADIRAAVLNTLKKATSSGKKKTCNIIERVEPRIRELEDLPERRSEPLEGKKTVTDFELNGLEFQYDALAGQKTGAFLDQRENYAAAERWAHGEALDVFCYQGGFALHLARKCAKVAAVDQSRAALEAAEENEERNRKKLLCAEVEWTEGNAFDLLKDLASSGKGRRYDTIVLDPPAFAKSKRNLETAIRGYKEINLRALKMLREGGVLVTCSCSHAVRAEDFAAMLASAAADAKRTVRIVEKRGAALDHPAIATIPETDYLKCLICIVA